MSDMMIQRYQMNQIEEVHKKLDTLSKKMDKILDILDPDIEPELHENPVLQQQLENVRESIARQPASTRNYLSGKFKTK